MKIYQPLGSSPRLREPDASAFRLILGRVLYYTAYGSDLTALLTAIWPDHLAEPRSIPGTGRVMFTGVGHHNWFIGSIGIIDPKKGSNYPYGLTRVTWDLPWAEVSSPGGDRPESPQYHASGRYSGHLGAYPISQDDFLVSAMGLQVSPLPRRSAGAGSADRPIRHSVCRCVPVGRFLAQAAGDALSTGRLSPEAA